MSCVYNNKEKNYSQTSGIPHTAITDFITYSFFGNYLMKAKF